MLTYFLLLDLHIIFVFCFFYHILSIPHRTRIPRPPHWAVPVYAEGLPNLYRVTPQIFRSANPQPHSLPSLQALNIRTVLSLCREKEETFSFPGIQTVSIPMSVSKPDMSSLENALNILEKFSQNSSAVHDNTAQDNGNILVHCTHGADRTGLVIALYRIKIQQWTKEEALAEMLEGGYGCHIFWPQNAEFLKKNF